VIRDGLARLRRQPLEPTTKGFAGADPAAVPDPDQLMASGADLTDPMFSTPLLVLRETAIEHNVRTMAEFCASSGVLLAPHAKTTMSPEIFTRQLAAGAWGLTAANPLRALPQHHVNGRDHVSQHDRLGGVRHEYQQVA
jgi:hypothetical protein